MLSIFTARKDLVPKRWQASEASLQLLMPALYLVDQIGWNNKLETEILDMLRDTDVMPLIPENPSSTGQQMSAVCLDRNSAIRAHSAIWTGPWCAAYPSEIEILAETIGAALDREAHTLLIVRE